jgi:hypothetical protein
MTAGGGHPLQGFERQLVQWGWADAGHIIGNTCLGSVRISMVVTTTSSSSTKTPPAQSVLPVRNR